MFNIFKKKKRDPFSLESVKTHLQVMGYDLLPYGVAVAWLELRSGYNDVETASHIALTTMALDIKRAENAIIFLAFWPHARALLEVLKKYKDNGQMHPTQWQNDSAAILHIVYVDKNQSQWIDDILSDPIAGKERLANSRVDYNVDFPSDEEGL